MDRIDSVNLTQNTDYTSLGERFNQSAVKKTERLPFTIRVVSNLADLDKAVEMRRAAYRRHLPEFAETMGVEALDGASRGVTYVKLNPRTLRCGRSIHDV
ncbi:hypothetical protein [Paraburkholderia sp. SIMBA_030]|uniref:hypothetical protein n=1 Tax=Paraburkholderia sp. SIMBA_030 TaxID=3085773 RepID=UPI00397CFC88